MIPANPTSEATVAAYDANNKAIDFLLASLSRSEFDRVSDETLAHSIWTKFEAFHEGTNTVKARLF